ncbi:MAG: PepSY domain-containing protein [Bdellovibrionia bacterium]
MKFLFISLMVLSASTTAFAKKNCTNEPKEKWMSEEAFKAKVQADGYTINKFKQPGSCYEIYGLDKEGKKVEIYFNPVDGSIVKQK